MIAFFFRIGVPKTDVTDVGSNSLAVDQIVATPPKS
jgi:hypothetical protein